MCLIFFTLLPLYLTVVLSIPVMAVGAGLAFYKVNDRPLIVVVEHASAYFFGTKLYLWKPRRAEPAVGGPTKASAQPAPEIVPKLTESKLRDLAWSLNIKETSDTSGPPQGLAI